jgi:putative thioredoxin
VSASPHVLEVTDRTFEKEVMERSKQVPVLVDFWAPWCGPCRVLGPTLEKVVAEYQGRVVLAKVNADENPNLAYAFQVQSIPMVALMVDGEAVDGFLGAQGEAQVRALIDRHVTTTAGDAAAQAEAAYVDGDVGRARRLIEGVLAKKDAPASASLLRARIAVREGDGDRARTLVAALPEESPEARQGAQILAALDVLAGVDGEATAYEARLARDATDLEARYEVGRVALRRGRAKEALDLFLEIVKRDRAWRGDAGRKAMLAAFALLGPAHPLTSDYRRALALYL